MYRFRTVSLKTFGCNMGHIEQNMLLSIFRSSGIPGSWSLGKMAQSSFQCPKAASICRLFLPSFRQEIRQAKMVARLCEWPHHTVTYGFLKTPVSLLCL